MRAKAWSVVERWCLWLGAAALVCVAGTTASAAIYQQYLSWSFEQAAAPAVDGRAFDEPAIGRPRGIVGRLDVPRIGLSVMVLEGTGRRVLVAGAGHVPGTPLPGAAGNVALAAHRDTYFRRLERIRPGDDVQVATAEGTYRYVVDSTEVVDPADTRVIESHGRSELTLITCYPFGLIGPAPRRFIVHARLLF